MSALTDLISEGNRALIVHETTLFIALMAPSPNAPGHIICFPKQEINDLFALDRQTYQALMDFCQTVAQALAKAVPCRKIGMASIGLAVEHIHLHLVPINEARDMNFMTEHDKVDDGITQRLAQDIKALIKQTVNESSCVVEKR